MEKYILGLMYGGALSSLLLLIIFLGPEPYFIIPFIFISIVTLIGWLRSLVENRH